MNFNKAKKEYQKTEISSNATKSAMELVEIMAKELNKSMGIVVNCLRNKETEFWKTDSKSHSFKKYMENNFFDLVLIDGDHSYEGVKNDYEYIKDRAKIVVLHDIVNNAAEGVVKFWNELKKDKEKYDFFEFKDQYEEVVQKTGSTFLGIGVAIKK